MRGWKRITRTHMTPLTNNNLAAPDIRLGGRGSLRKLKLICNHNEISVVLKLAM